MGVNTVCTDANLHPTNGCSLVSIRCYRRHVSPPPLFNSKPGLITTTVYTGVCPASLSIKAETLPLAIPRPTSSNFPGIRYAGRLVTDPPSNLGQGEATLFSGTASQTGKAAGAIIA